MIPAGDGPRFEWRGVMLDVARHFFPTDDVKRFVDLISRYRFNRLHLHLADDQGWRIEITSWPKLAPEGNTHARLFIPKDTDQEDEEHPEEDSTQGEEDEAG